MLNLDLDLLLMYHQLNVTTANFRRVSSVIVLQEDIVLIVMENNTTRKIAKNSLKKKNPASFLARAANTETECSNQPISSLAPYCAPVQFAHPENPTWFTPLINPAQLAKAKANTPTSLPSSFVLLVSQFKLHSSPKNIHTAINQELNPERY